MKYLLLFISISAFAVDPSNGKKLTFSDDFTGEKVDDKKWSLPVNCRPALSR
jgi:hypothetical protein